MNIEEFRIEYPEYNHVSDDELSETLHQKFYSNVPFEKFETKFNPKRAEHRKVAQERLSAAQAIEIDEPSFMKDVVGGTAKEIGEYLVATGETAAEIVGGVIEFKASAIAGIAGLAKLITTQNPEEATKTIQDIQTAMHPYVAYEAQTEKGKQGIQPVKKVFETLHKLSEKTGEKVLEKVTPVIGKELGAGLATTTANIVQLLPIIVGIGAKQVPSLVRSIKQTKVTRTLARRFSQKELEQVFNDPTKANPEAIALVQKLGDSGQLAQYTRQLAKGKGGTLYTKQEKLLLKPKSEWTTTDIQIAVDGIKQITQQPKQAIMSQIKSIAKNRGRSVADIAHGFLTDERGSLVKAKATEHYAFQLLVPKEGASPLKRVGLDRNRPWKGWDKTVPIIKQVGLDKLTFNKVLNADIKKWEGGLTPGNYHFEGKIEDLINIKDKNLQINPIIGQRTAKITISDQITEYEQHGQHDPVTGNITLLAASKEYALDHLAHEAPGHEGDRLLDLPRGRNLANTRLQAEKELMKLNSEQAKISKQIIEARQMNKEFPLTMKKRIESLSLIYKTLQEQMDALPLAYKDSYAVYEKSYGEISARDTAVRRHLTTKQLQHSRLFDSQEFDLRDVNVVHYNTKTQVLNQALKEHRHGDRRKATRRIDDLNHLTIKLTPEEAKSVESIMPAMTDMKIPKWNSKAGTLTFDGNFMEYLDYINFVNQKIPHINLNRKLYEHIEEKAPINESRPSKLDDMTLTMNAQTKKFKDSERGSISFKKKVKPFKFAKGIETRFQKAHGITKEPLGTRAKKQLESFWHQLTREFEHLPKSREFADLQFMLNRGKKLQGISNFQTTTALDELTTTLKGASDSKNAFDLYRRKIILDDLVETLELNPDTALPFGFDSTTLAAETVRLNEAITTTPGIDGTIIKGALNKRSRFLEKLTLEYTKWMKTVGKDFSKSFTRKSYYRHQVLDRLQFKSNERLHKGLKVPPKHGFTLERKGSTLDINTNYFEAEGEVMAKMLYDIQIAKTINDIRQSKYNIAPQVRANAKDQGIDNWYDAIPEGYVTWQPKEGNVFYLADTIPAQLADKIIEGMATEMGIDPKVIRKAWTKGRKFEEFVVKESIKKTLDSLFEHPVEGKISRGSGKILTAWKGYIALSHPKGIAKFNIRNMTGDADAVYVGNPSTRKRSIQAVQELKQGYIKRGELTKNLKDFFELGAIDATLLSQELSISKDLDLAHKFIQKSGGISKIPEKVWNGYWKGARMLSDTRELVLRYASYLDYLDQMKVNNGIPNNFGASIPEEIMGLSNIKHRAFWLSNDLLGAYDRVGMVGQQIAKHAYPFYRWKEVNFTRYNRFMKNAIKDPNLQIEMGKGIIDSTFNRKGAWKNFINPARLAKIGRFALRASALWASAQVGNEYVYPEEEKGLPNNIRSRPHIILGNDDKGDVIHFDRIGALGDYLEWFGLDDAPQKYKDFMTGRKTLKEIVKDMALAPVNVAVQGITPLLKVPVEFLTRKSFFPDVASPRIIKDRALYVAQQLRLGDEYKIIMDMPRKKYDISKLFVYKSDPDESAYHDAFDLKRDFLKGKGKTGEGYWISDQGSNLFNMKMAIRYDDKELAEKYFLDYIANGGDPSTLSTAMDTLSPFSNINEIDLSEFLLNLNAEEQTIVKKAFGFYKENVFKVVDFVKTLDERVIIDVLKSIELPKELSKQEQEKLVSIIKDITGMGAE